MKMKEAIIVQFNKKISKAGAVTLPAVLRRAAGIESGEKFSINLQEDGSILLKRTQGNCIFCESETDLVPFKGRFICNSCSKAIGGDTA